MTSNNTLNSQIEETKHDFNSITNDFKNLTTSSNTVSDAIKQIQATLKGIKETKDGYEKFKDDFGKTIASLGDAFAQYNQIVPISKEFTPTIANLDDIIKELATKSHLVVLTGAGLSAASNIPTFRGEGGYWTLRNKQEKLKATDFLTHEYFVSEQSATEEVWRWHHELKRLVTKNTPNISHTALAELQLFCKKFDINFSLITQNVDGYHVEAYVKALEKSQKQPISKTAPDMQKKQLDEKKAKTTTASKNVNMKSFEDKPAPRFTVPSNLMNKYGIFNDIYEIHGSIYYMRCDKDCTTNLFAAPEVGCADNFVPKCLNCQGTARPHTLFFDESYEEEYYRGQSLMKQISSMDCLLVIGTALETYLACKIVKEAVKSNKLIIEVNPQPRIQNGNVKHFIGNAEEFIPTLCEGYQKIKTESARY